MMSNGSALADGLRDRAPQRLKRARRKGYTLPGRAIYDGRPTLWGNPFSVGPRAAGGHGSHARCVILHKAWLAGQLGDLTLERMHFSPSEIEALHRKRIRTLERLPDLAGHDLACWCPLTSAWCHAETLLRLAAAVARSGPEYERFAA